MLSSEVERLKHQMGTKNDELSRLRAQAKDLEGLQRDFEQVSTDNNSLNEANADLAEQLAQEQAKFKQQTQDLTQAEQVRT